MSDIFVLDLENAIKQRDSIAAISIFQNALSNNSSKSINQVRKKGLFRASKYEFRAEVIADVVKSALQMQATISLKEEEIVYLESVLSLVHFAFTARSVFKKLYRSISINDLKSFIISVELLFWEGNVENGSTVKTTHKDWSAEELSEAFSYYYYLFSNKFDSFELNQTRIDTKAIKKGVYLNTLSDLSKLLYLKKCELMVDNFNYIARRNKSEVYIESPNVIFEKSRKIGYINSEIQMIGDYYKSLSQQTGVSIFDFSKKFSRRLKDKIFKIETHPVKRIVMSIPIIDLFKGMITQDSLFNEEMAELSAHSKELLISEDQILTVNIYNNLTILDIVKFQRFIRLLHWSFETFIDDCDLRESNLLLESIIPVFSSLEFKNILEELFGKEKSESLIELLSWDSTSDQIFDLQYSPIINIGKWSVTPLALIAKSNLVRNALQTTRFRFDSESDVDPVGLVLSESLKRQSSIVYRDLKYKWKNQNGDIDVLAIIDNSLFIFECKNSLHPCSPFELRTSYDYIKKASNQLTRIQELLTNPKFRSYLSGLIDGVDLEDVKVTTCIAMGNRMFSGWQESGHKVRPIHELCNIIDEGSIGLSRIKGDNTHKKVETIKIWKSNKFAPQDLTDYIISDSLYAPRFESMVEIDSGVKLKKKKLIRKTYALDNYKLYKMYTESFASEKLSI
ncbi:hypothetical protein [Desulfosediminicola sp.]|uniref:hypothetical protein n=1 Tax=Desulfosediminicola sp. TaxID=2886825 RepID=UPI003AF27947